MNIKPDVVRQEIAWTLALESETDAKECLTQIVERIDDTKALAGGVNGRIAELELRLQRFVLREKALRALAYKIMDAAGLRKMELPLATLSIRQGQQRVEILDERLVPDVLCKITRTPDKAKIKEMLLGGKAVNWATLQHGDNSLSIRTR
jgi:hypothetical protein